MWMDVDTALAAVPVNILALIDSTDFKTREESVVYNQSGLDLLWNFVTTAGAFTQTAVTPTDTAGDYDWINKGNAMYTIEMPSSGGASINNDAEGFGWFTGFATGILPWTGPVIGFRAAALNNALIDGGDNLDINLVQWLGTAAATPSVAGVPEVDMTHVAGTVQTAGDLVALLNTIDDFLDTEIAAITAAVITNAAGVDIAADIIALKAETVLILADTNEMQGDQVNGGRLDLIWDAIKAITDQFVFTKANEVDSNMLSVAGTVQTAGDLVVLLNAIDDFIDTEITDIQSRLPAALTGGGNMKSDMLAINGSTAAAVRLALASAGMVTGTVHNAVAPTTTVFECDDITEATADHYKGKLTLFTSGALLDQVTDVTGYRLLAGRGEFTVTALTSAPANDVTVLFL